MFVALLSSGHALAAQKIQVTTSDGGSVVTPLSQSIKVNDKSSLHRIWVMLNDPGCPVQLENAGITTAYGDREYLYRQSGTFKASEPVVALEVRYVLYDIFGDHLKTLSATSVEDVAADTQLPLSELGRWRGWENEVAELLTVVAFVAQVRTINGKVWHYQDKVAFWTQLRRSSAQSGRWDFLPRLPTT